MNNNAPTSPPRLATRFLNWFLKPELAEEVNGRFGGAIFHESGRRK